MSPDSVSTAAAAAPAGRRDRLALLLLGLALLLAATRAWRLGEWSLWLDEAYTLTDAGRAGQFRNPLGYWIWSRWIELSHGPISEAWLRAPACLFGALAILLTAWAFRPLLGSRAAAGAALLLAASSWHAYWSQTARFYTLAQSMSLLGAGLYLRSLEGGGVARALLGLACAALAALAHPSAGGLLPALIAAPWVLELCGRRCAGLSFAQVARPVLRTGALLAGLLALPGAWYAWGLFRRWSLLKGGGDPAHFVLATGFQATPVLLAGVLCALVLALAARERRVLLIALVATLFLGLALCLSPFVRVTAQYAFLVLPWLCASAAALLVPSLAGGRGPALAGYALLLLPALAQLFLYHTVRRGERPAWREAYRYVFEHRESSDLVLGMEAPVAEHYLGEAGADLRLPRSVGWLDSWRADVPGQWSRYPRRTWFVLNPEQLEDWRDPHLRASFEEMLRTDCRLVACWPLYVESRDLSVWVYVREP